MKKIAVINGPNLNLLGKREPELYGKETLANIITELKEIAKKSNIDIDDFQDNSEGNIVTKIQNIFLNQKDFVGLLINVAAYTHTSLAILDSLKLFSKDFPIIEIHLTDPKKREEFRNFSYISQRADKVFKGEGKKSYVKGVEYILNQKGILP